jgi:hypothetical protein
MRLPAGIPFLLLPLAYAILCSPELRAQSSPASGAECAPMVTCDEFKELTGKKVYPKVIIDDVSFEGPVSIPHDVLDGIIKDLTSRKFDSDSKWLDEVEEVAIRGTWQEYSYFKAEVSAQAVPRGGDDTYQHFSVIFHVVEGPQYWMGRVTFQSANPDEHLAFSAEELRKLLPFRPGDLCDVDKIRQSLDALKRFYGAHGYIDLAPTPETETDDVNHVVNIKMILDQQRQYKIGRVSVCGSDSRFESRLSSEVKSGELFDAPRLKSFFEINRAALGPHFGSENVQYELNPKTGTVNITVSLRNCPLLKD